MKQKYEDGMYTTEQDEVVEVRDGLICKDINAEEMWLKPVTLANTTRLALGALSSQQSICNSVSTAHRDISKVRLDLYDIDKNFRESEDSIKWYKIALILYSIAELINFIYWIIK